MYNYLFYGLPGTGKSTFIKELKNLLDFEYVSIDHIWQTTFQNPCYTFEESEIVFNKLLHDINNSINKGNRIVVEGMFATRERVITIKEIFSKKDLPFKTILLTASQDTIKDRIIVRKKQNDISYENILFFSKRFSSQIEADCIIDTDYVDLSNIHFVIKKEFGL
jgi:predicted kinase